MRYAEAWPVFRDKWDHMVIKPEREKSFSDLAAFAIKHKTEYGAVENATGLPWPMVAVIHRREGDGNFDTYLGNGQSLHMRTTIVPKGRGPFESFLAGAIDAVKVEGWGHVIDWRLEKQLYYCGLFNGLYSLQTPYLWGGTNQQKRGKYVADHVYNPFVWDPQPGCAPILWMIAKLDPSVKFVRESSTVSIPVHPATPTTEFTMNWSSILQALLANAPSIISLLMSQAQSGVPATVGAVKVLGCKILQEALNIDLGTTIPIDGSYGAATDAAVQQALAKVGISGSAAGVATSLIKLAVVP